MALPTSYSAQSNYTSTWASLYSIEFPPEIYNEWFQRYGQGFKILDFLRMFGKEQTVRDRTFYHYEDGTDLRACTLASAIVVGIAGANITFTLAAADYDASNNGPLRDQFTVLIPKGYQTTGEDRLYVVVSNDGGVGAARIYTCSPLSADSQISVQVPIATELMIGASVYAAGTGQPEGMASGTYRRTHYTQIVKESCGFEGGQIAKRKYRETITKAGTAGLFDKGLIETEFRLDRQIDSALFKGEPNTNALTQVPAFGGTNNRLGTQGLWNWQLDLAQSIDYVADFDMDYFDQVKGLLQTQGVVNAEVAFLMGSDLMMNVENNVLDALKEWSGGTDLLSEKNKAFQVNFKSVLKNGVKFLVGELASFSNPTGYGLASYDFQDAGMIIPMGNVSVSNGFGGEKVSVPNISICYFRGAGEDRTRVIDTVAGMNGLGHQAVDQYDRTHIWMLSEFACFAANVNQHIQIMKA
ncbi:MAG TPA: hypothetical protein VMV74_01640 [Bacteroidales bacterium]|nr:hypothetical protein [Bacteroidales bacterium]